MAETEPDFSDPKQVASLTFAYLRRIEARMTHADETMAVIMRNFIRMDERFSRMERDLGELKRDVAELRSDLALMENRVINVATETLHIVQRLDDAGVPAGFKSPEKPYTP